jgi:glycosyltransferase involved in cell wall biosynthesis
MLLDKLSRHFKKVYYIASTASDKSNLYVDGESVYSYIVKAENVELVEIVPEGEVANLLKKVKIMIENQIRIKKIVKAADLVYIFVPGYSSLITSFIARFYRKTYFLYCGSYWRETGPLRLEALTSVSIVKKCIFRFYPLLENYVAKKAVFSLVVGKKLLHCYKNVSRFVYEAVPRVQFKCSSLSKCKTRMCLKKNIAILYVGPVKRNKGIKYLINAIHYLDMENFQTNLQLVGTIDVAYKAELNKIISDLGLDKRIKFVGYISDANKLQRYYIESDIFVIPTLGEGFPRVIYEAMLFGSPVVATDIDSIRATLGSDGFVTLVPPRNSRKISNAIIELCTDNRLYKKRAEGAMTFAKRKLRGDPVGQLIVLLKHHSLYY